MYRPLAASLAATLLLVLLLVAQPEHTHAYIAGLQQSTASLPEPVQSVYYDSVQDVLWASSSLSNYVYVFNSTTLDLLNTFSRISTCSRLALVTFQPLAANRRLLVCDNYNGDCGPYNVCDLYNLDTPLATSSVSSTLNTGSPVVFVRAFPSASTPFAITVQEVVSSTTSGMALRYYSFSATTGFVGSPFTMSTDRLSSSSSNATICGGALPSSPNTPLFDKRWKVTAPGLAIDSYTMVYHADFFEQQQQLRIWCQNIEPGAPGGTFIRFTYYNMTTRPCTPTIGTYMPRQLTLSVPPSNVGIEANILYRALPPVLSSDTWTSYWLLDSAGGGSSSIFKMPVNASSFGFPSISSAAVSVPFSVVSAVPYDFFPFPSDSSDPNVLGPELFSLSFGKAVDDTTSSSFSVLFLADLNSNIRKFYFNSQASAFTLTEFDQQLDNTLSAQPTSLTVSSSQQLVYGALGSSVISFSLAACDSATNCTSCVALNNPYCGWCTLQGACTTLKQCSNTSGSWTQQSTSC